MELLGRPFERARDRGGSDCERVGTRVRLRPPRSRSEVDQTEWSVVNLLKPDLGSRSAVRARSTPGGHAPETALGQATTSSSPDGAMAFPMQARMAAQRVHWG